MLSAHRVVSVVISDILTQIEAPRLRARVYVDWTQHITEQWLFVTTVTNNKCRYCTGQVRRSDTRPCVSTTCEMKPAVMTRYLLLIDSAHSDSLFNPQSSTKPVFS